jgi:ribosomal-protein-alanine N-acetyltransferase
MVTIEPLEAAQFEAAAGWLATPAINQWLTGEWRSADVNAPLIAIAVRNRRNRFFVIRHEGEPVGLVALSNIEELDRTAMIWYALGRQDLGGKGIATTAVKLLSALAFTEMRFASVYAWVMEGNGASRRVLEKAGFSQAGRLRRASTFLGAQVDRIYFDLLPADAPA